MRRHAPAITLFFVCCLLVYAPAMAEESAQSIPNMLGTWIGAGQAQTVKSMHDSTMEWRIPEQKGIFFRGIISWTVSAKPEAGHYVGGKPTASASEAMLGVIAHDNKTIYVAEQDDSGVYHCRLQGPDTLETIYVESGSHAAIARFLFKRQK